jgi:hypothetical protein
MLGSIFSGISKWSLEFARFLELSAAALTG